MLCSYSWSWIGIQGCIRYAIANGRENAGVRSRWCDVFAHVNKNDTPEKRHPPYGAPRYRPPGYWIRRDFTLPHRTAFGSPYLADDLEQVILAGVVEGRHRRANWRPSGGIGRGC